MTDETDEDLELEVTITFGVPVTNTHDLGPREMATHTRDIWVDDPEEFVAVIGRAVAGDDYTLQVKPFTEP